MTSFRLGLRMRVAGASLAGFVALAGCGDDGGDDGSDSIAGTTNPTNTSATDTGSSMDDDSSGSPSDTSGGNTDISHAMDIQPIWDEHCTEACHEPGGEWSFLDMSEGTAYGAIVDVPATQVAAGMDFIEPGDPDASYLWHKINSTQLDAGGGGLAMPKARGETPATVMTQAQLDLVRDWILAGAPM